MNDTHKTTEYTASVREYINSLSENELIEYGRNEFDGKDQMFAALDTIDKLAAHSEEEARMAYLNFLEVNLCGFSTEFKD